MLRSRNTAEQLQSVYSATGIESPLILDTISDAQSIIRDAEIGALSDEWNKPRREIENTLNAILYENATPQNNNIDPEMYQRISERLQKESSAIKYGDLRNNYLRYGVLSGSFVLHLTGTAPENHSRVEAAYITPAGLNEPNRDNWLASLVITRNVFNYDATITVYRQEEFPNMEDAHEWVASRIEDYSHIPLGFGDFASGLAVVPIKTGETVDIPIRPLNANSVPEAIQRHCKRQMGSSLDGKNFEEFTEAELLLPSQTTSVLYDAELDEYITLIPYRGGFTIPRPGCIELDAGDGGEWLHSNVVRERISSDRYQRPRA